MEENNNIIIKGLAIILIIILGLNVYRTETTKKELATLSATVNQIRSQVDSLEFPVGQPAASVGTNSNQIKGLEKRVAGLESKVNTLKSSVDRLSKESSQTSPQKTASSVTSSNNTSATNFAAGSSGRVSVSAKVKVDNRYVSGTTYLPKVTTGPEGVVVVNVTMGRIGTVGSVSINSASTINDEEILDLCKEAALKTNFAYNPDAPDKSKGTITYMFKKK